ncbi:agmatine deiminase family protein [Coraliomargarita sp. SDUM461004]|uniref:Agmatine deiminase family protein n=1 Tax=Thalassobacterium sedimentorum TaxID=3041258 RepID=A0ABU1AEV4_9BACT|nr:agmatine deiminase family protein [Coraliomargarita sp. SDUM461004]MDQ8193302.1 agmatine deiminase family protein [Coraliomargarita sp. SDUM461004]
MSRLKTPKELGYRFPAEWEPQAAIWFAWPVRRSLWPDCFDRVREQLAALYVLAARYQPVRVLCALEEQETLRALMASQGDDSSVELFDYQSDDVWIRDFGPLFLINDAQRELCIADWRYNAWGNKFPDQQKDDRASAWIADQLGIRRFAFDQVLEGGAVESNGAGHILTTEVVVLNPSRNGDTTAAHVERQLTSGLGANEVLWLHDGLVGDDTDGHIDNLARFFKADGILIAEVADPEDANYPALTENIERLQQFRTPAGAPFASVQLPLPEPITHEGEPLAASYLNFVVLNGAVLVPTYNQPKNDAEAIEIIGDCFPGREVVGVDCTDIIKEGGALHCMSQHQPAV